MLRAVYATFDNSIIAFIGREHQGPIGSAKLLHTTNSALFVRRHHLSHGTFIPLHARVCREEKRDEGTRGVGGLIRSQSLADPRSLVFLLRTNRTPLRGVSTSNRPFPFPPLPSPPPAHALEDCPTAFSAVAVALIVHASTPQTPRSASTRSWQSSRSNHRDLFISSLDHAGPLLDCQVACGDAAERPFPPPPRFPG